MNVQAATVVTADVHMLLADHSTEQENYETALEDLKRALALLQSELKVMPKRTSGKREEGF